MQLAGQAEEAGHTLLALKMRDLLRMPGGSGAGALGIWETVDSGKPDSTAEGERFFELTPGLAREAGDDVCRDGGAGHGRADTGGCIEESGGGIAAAHRGKDAIAAGLQGKMKLRHQAGILPEGEQFGRDVLWLQGAEADARDFDAFEDAGDEVMRRERRREIATPGAELCARNHGFPGARSGNTLYIGRNCVDGAGFLTAAGAGDDAEGADIVTALLSLDKSASVERSGNRRGIDGEAGPASSEEIEKLRAVRLARAKDDIGSEGTHGIVAGTPGKTAGHGDGSGGVDAADRADQAARLLVGDVGDGAGIDHVGVGFDDAVDDAVPGSDEVAGNRFAVCQVELAAEGDDRGERAAGHGFPWYARRAKGEVQPGGTAKPGRKAGERSTGS